MADISTDISKLKVAELKRELKNRNLSTTGNKQDLMQRLEAALASNASIVTTDSDLLEDDDVLNEDLEDDMGERSEELDTNSLNELNTKDSELNLNSTEDLSSLSKPVKRKLSETESNKSEPKHPKKIVLNRTISESPKKDSVRDEEEEPKVAPPSSESVEKTDDKKVIKLSELSAKERLEMRMKKFGAPPPSDSVKEARIKRFGVIQSQTGSESNGVKNVNVDVLKKRAERFGGSVSSVMSKLDVQERLEKRKARFGLS